MNRDTALEYNVAIDCMSNLIDNVPRCLSTHTSISQAQHLRNVLVPRGHANAERDGRATRQTVVLLEVDGLLRQLLHVECPQQASDSEEDLLLSKSDTRADAAATWSCESVSRSVSRLTAPLFSLSRRSCRLMGGSEETPETIECALVPLSQELLVIVYTRSLHRSKP